MKKKGINMFMGIFLACVLLLSACKTNAPAEEPGTTTKPSAVEQTSEDISKESTAHIPDETQEVVDVPEGNYIELALNVYYNDADHSYFNNESGSSIYVTDNGTYTLSFDCDKDLSDDAKAAGVSSLTNLTAIYLLDMGASKSAQSPLRECQIKYDKVVVDATELTITKTESKSAFKSSGVFDTNDPINSWDGSAVEEVVATSEHVANFTNIVNPKTVSVTFTLSNMKWAEEEVVENPKEPEKVVEGGNSSVFSGLDFKNMDALTLSKYMGNGINLGNTMEAYGHATLGFGAAVSTYETYWGQPVTTPQMLQAMKACGFDSIRIPIAWTNMMNYEAGDYTIDKAYIDRVEEIVNYALDAEMFVVINDHWDGGWWAMFGSQTEATRQRAWDMYESIWTQVSERFADYSEMLIFESANEELGNALNDNSHCADSGNLTLDECYTLTNEINQKFVDIVRNSGGKNTDRFLLIAGYNTDIEKTVDARFIMPKDTAKSKLLVSVHYYTPWTYCGAEKQARWGIKKDYQTMNDLLGQLTKFTDAGYGVIIGEYAALPVYHQDTQSSELKENTLEFTTNFLDNCDIYNYVPMLWSCNDFFNKKSLSMITDEVGQLFASRSYEKEAANPDYLNEVKTSMKKAENGAISNWPDVKPVVSGAPYAWIMWNGGAGTYSVGDAYNPADCTNGITADDVILSGAGEYEVGLEFRDGNDGLTFAALGIANGESLFKNAVIDIKQILIDGEVVELIGEPYTCSDDGRCMRVNLLNAWVSKVPDGARSLTGDLTNASPVILDKTKMVGIHSIRIKFELIMP